VLATRIVTPEIVASIATQPRCSTTPGATGPMLAAKVRAVTVGPTVTRSASTRMTSWSVTLMPGTGFAVRFVTWPASV